MPHGYYRRGVRLAALCLLAVAPAATGQKTGPTSIASDSFLALVPPRQLNAINRDLDAARQARASAEQAEQSAVALRSGADARIALKNRQIADADSRRKLAERQKRDAEVTALNAEKQAFEREKDLLERRKSLREVEIDLARKRRELSDLTLQALELERQLAVQRAKRSGVAVGGTESARASQVVFELEKATLDAQRRRADKEGDVAGREKRVIERRLEILEAQRRVIGGT